jgi:multidrug efflux pump subunit AcrA (membrane-fusion protein)
VGREAVRGAQERADRPALPARPDQAARRPHHARRGRLRDPYLGRPEPGSAGQFGAARPAYYTIRISLPAAEMARLKDIRLIPGMPAEAFIQTHERTPLEFLLKPLQEQIARTFRER